MLDLTVETLNILMYSQKNPLGGGLFSVSCRSKVYTCNLIGRRLRRLGFPVLVLQDSCFYARYLCLTFSNKVAGFQSMGCNFFEIKVFDKYIRTKGYLQCVNEDLILLECRFRCQCQCQDFQMNITKTMD